MAARYLFIASMDVDADREALFNEVYDTEHIPMLLKVPGVLSARRYSVEPLSMLIGGQRFRGVRTGKQSLGHGGGSGALAHRGQALHPQPPAPAV
jgi:hypothetical protein